METHIVIGIAFAGVAALIIAAFAYFHEKARAQYWQGRNTNAEARAEHWFGTTVEAIAHRIVDHTHTVKALRYYEAKRKAFRQATGIETQGTTFGVVQEEQDAFAALASAIRTGDNTEREGQGGQVPLSEGAPESRTVRAKTK